VTDSRHDWLTWRSAGHPAFYQELTAKPTFAAVSRDKHVFIFTGPALRIVARLVLTWLLILLLLVPVVVVHALEGMALQILCIMVASGMFVFVLSGMMQARLAEIFVAGAT